MDYHGLDVSQWQGTIDFQKVKENGFSLKRKTVCQTKINTRSSQKEQ